MQSFERCAIGAQNATYFARGMRRQAAFATLRASIAIPERPGGKSCMLKIAFSARAPLPVAQHR